MAYQALYRSYRPITFSDVAGQRHVIKTLKNALINHKTSHAYLFSGPRGIGKTTIARILARALNCQQLTDGEPCNHCPSCQEILNGQSTDIIEIDAATNNGVEEMRNLLERVNYLPGFNKYKVYIIDEVHMLSLSAFNALLKTLEEPPAHVVFIFATTEPHKIPLTVISRCQRFDFKPLTIKEIVAKLEEVIYHEKIIVEPGVLEMIAEASNGGMRDALGILDQINAYNNQNISLEDVYNVTGRISYQIQIELLELLHNHNITQAIAKVNELIDSGKEVNRVVLNLLLFCRDLLLYQCIDHQANRKLIYDNQEFIKLSRMIPQRKIFCFVEILSELQIKIKNAVTPKIFLEIAIMKMANISQEDYQSAPSTHQSISTNIDADEIETKINTFLVQVQELKDGLNQLQFPEFKDYVKAKIDFLENLAATSNIPPLRLETKIDELEEKIKTINPHNDSSTPDLTDQIDSIIDQKVNQIITDKLPSFDQESSYQQIKAQILNELNQLPISTNSSEVNDHKIDTLDQKLENFGLQQTKLENSINSLNQRFHMIENTLNSLVEDLEKLNSTPIYQPTEPELSIDDNLVFDISEFDKTNSDYQYTQLKELIEQLPIEQLTNQINELITNNQELSTRMVTLEQQQTTIITDINQKIDQLTTRIDQTNYQEEYQKIVSLMDDYKKYLFQMGAKTTKLDENYLEQSKTIASLKEQIVSLTKTEPLTKTPQVETPTPRPVPESQPVNPLPTPQPVEIVTVKPEPAVVEMIETDESSKYYNHRVLEDVMHKARDQRLIPERNRVNELWKQMTNKVSSNLLSIAKMLVEGKMVVYAGTYIVIIYPTPTICNQLMSPQFHQLARQVFKASFGKEFEFMALPENTWQKKNNEYRDQYRSGITYPRLTPFDNPELKVIIRTSQTTPKSPEVVAAHELFGEKIVKEIK